jgi:glycosyltransferase involved in cell wall biosynthesis
MFGPVSTATRAATPPARGYHRVWLRRLPPGMDLQFGSSTVLVVGPLPPPFNGMTRMTHMVLRASLIGGLKTIHVDTSDHRPISTVGRIDFRNIFLALKHSVGFVSRLLLHRPDLVYIPVSRDRLGFLRDALFLLPTRLSGRRLIVHLHSRDFQGFFNSEPIWMRLLIRACLSKSVHAIVLAENRRNDFGSLVEPDHIHVVPNGVLDIGEGPEEARDTTMVLHIATLRPEKGTFAVLEAAHALHEILPNLRVVIAGDWYHADSRSEAHRYVDRENLGDVVCFAGVVEGARKDALLRKAAVMAFPTAYAYESQPLVLLEALAAGTPVVTTALGAIPEMITDGREGYLIGAGDVDQLAGALLRVLENSDLRRAMGRAARHRFEEDFNEQAFAERLLEAWHQALYAK